MENYENRGKKPRPPYWLGFFCLIPIIGLFAGLIISYRGLYKYRNWQFTMIGVIGFILNAAICYWPVYNLEYGKAAGIQFAKTSQKRVDNIARQVEIYKKLNGVYPDSLQQLRTLNSYLDLVDPLQARRLKDVNMFFIYQKIGDRYTLYSVGIDGIPHTADDIYPSKDLDSNNIGLVRLRQ